MMSRLTCFRRFVLVKPIILFQMAYIDASDVYTTSVYITSYYAFTKSGNNRVLPIRQPIYSSNLPSNPKAFIMLF